MKALSIIFGRTFNRGPAGLVVAGAPPIPYHRVRDFDRLECRVDLVPCSMASGDMTPAPPGTLLLQWPGESVAIPTDLIRTIAVKE